MFCRFRFIGSLRIKGIKWSIGSCLRYIINVKINVRMWFRLNFDFEEYVRVFIVVVRGSCGGRFRNIFRDSLLDSKV